MVKTEALLSPLLCLSEERTLLLLSGQSQESGVWSSHLKVIEPQDSLAVSCTSPVREAGDHSTEAEVAQNIPVIPDIQELRTNILLLTLGVVSDLEERLFWD